MTGNEHAGLAGKVVAVTGASSGIGEATARHLARLGAYVVVGARRTDRLEALAKELRGEGARVEHRALDVTRRASVEAFVGFARDRIGRGRSARPSSRPVSPSPSLVARSRTPRRPRGSSSTASTRSRPTQSCAPLPSR